MTGDDDRSALAPKDLAQAGDVVGQVGLRELRCRDGEPGGLKRFDHAAPAGTVRSGAVDQYNARFLTHSEIVSGERAASLESTDSFWEPGHAIGVGHAGGTAIVRMLSRHLPAAGLAPPDDRHPEHRSRCPLPRSRGRRGGACTSDAATGRAPQRVTVHPRWAKLDVAMQFDQIGHDESDAVLYRDPRSTSVDSNPAAPKARRTEPAVC